MGKRRLLVSIIGLVLFVVSCQPSTHNLEGTIEEHERIAYPISNRRIVMCQVQSIEEESSLPFSLPFQCTLLDQVAVSDEEGHFEFSDVPDGRYVFLYDSGLASFDEAVQTWAGKQIPIGDSTWLGSEFQGHPDGNVHVAPQLFPGGLAMVMNCGADFTTQYLVAHMIVPDSPFIVAHDVDTCLERCDLLHINAAIMPPPVEDQTIAFPAPYLRD